LKAKGIKTPVFGDGVIRDGSTTSFGWVFVGALSIVAPIVLSKPTRVHSLVDSIASAVIATVLIWVMIVGLLSCRLACTDKKLIIVGPWYRREIPWEQILQVSARGALVIELKNGGILKPAMFSESTIRAIFGGAGLRTVKAKLDGHLIGCGDAETSSGKDAVFELRFMPKTLTVITVLLVGEAMTVYFLG
jgi:hypothetical protein